MALQFSRETDLRIEELTKRYGDRHACLLPALALAQAEFGSLTHEVMELVDERLGIPAESVLSTSTFYSMLHLRPVGKYHVQVCGNVACFLRGCDSVLAAVSRELGVGPGGTTADGQFTLSTVECLAACGTAPVLMVKEDLYEGMTPEGAVALVRKLRGEP